MLENISETFSKVISGTSLPEFIIIALLVLIAFLMLLDVITENIAISKEHEKRLNNLNTLNRGKSNEFDRNQSCHYLPFDSIDSTINVVKHV